MEKFEYKILDVDKSKLHKSSFQSELISKLNDLGSQGWEVKVGKSFLWKELMKKTMGFQQEHLLQVFYFY